MEPLGYSIFLLNKIYNTGVRPLLAGNL